MKFDGFAFVGRGEKFLSQANGTTGNRIDKQFCMVVLVAETGFKLTAPA